MEFDMIPVLVFQIVLPPGGLKYTGDVFAYRKYNLELAYGEKSLYIQFCTFFKIQDYIVSIF